MHHSLTKYQCRITLCSSNITLCNHSTIPHNHTIILRSITRRPSTMHHEEIELAIEVEEEEEEALEEVEE
jgi:hypothetical protein